MTRFGIVVALVVMVLALGAAPAQAHGESQPAATNFKSAITDVAPAVDAITVRLVAGGSRMELRNVSADEVVIYGYRDEPYLRVTPSAVFVNERSPSAYVNEDLPSSPSHADDAPDAAPMWKKLSDSDTVRWHDHRTHWMSDEPPSVADANRDQRLRDWNVRIAVGEREVVREIVVAGTLDYLAPPRGELWWAGILTAAALVAALAAWRSRWAVVTLAGVLTVAAVAELADAVARAADTGTHGWGLLSTLLSSETYAVVTVVGALIAAGWVVWRRAAAAPFALALAAACLGVLGALTDVAVFSHGRATAAWSGDAARLATAVTLACCAGVVVAGWVMLRRQRSERADGVSEPVSAPVP